MADIDGALHANGSVRIASPAGVVFGPNADVRVHGLVAAAAYTDENAFLSSLTSDERLSFSAGAGEVRIRGAHIESDGGALAFIGAQVVQEEASVVHGATDSDVFYGVATSFILPLLGGEDVAGFASSASHGHDIDVKGATTAGQILRVEDRPRLDRPVPRADAQDPRWRRPDRQFQAALRPARMSTATSAYRIRVRRGRR